MQLSPRVRLHNAADPQASTQPEGMLSLPYVPDTAFGDGSHPTTRLCAGAVDLLCRQRRAAASNGSGGRGLAFLDVGTGTGVLARIARARGAQMIVATDIDPIALASARRHAELDGHSVPILISSELPDQWGTRFDLVVANILEGPLKELAPRLVAALAPGGQLLISGFTRLQIASLRVAFERAGVTMVSESVLDGWALLMFRRVQA